jgi:leucyl-tRNA synthetase
LYTAEIPGYGDRCAVTMCERLDIKSTKDKDKLKQAKDEVYLKGFYEGVMLVGECAGMKVTSLLYAAIRTVHIISTSLGTAQISAFVSHALMLLWDFHQVCDAKPIVRKTLMDRGDAIAYFEPESTVVGRSGDECIVALTDQWYLTYGDEQWRSLISAHVHDAASFNPYNASVLEAFDKAIDWLKEWACSREFGLGTQLPWDTKWVIDSLSDSTVYMALYTIAHAFFGGDADNLDGLGPAPCGISAQDLTDEIFDFIFLHKPLPNGFSTTIDTTVLEKLRAEFEYWYPMDLRVSAKDLIPNHLTMALYNHAEIWKEQPQMWPRGMYCNGHIMVNQIFLCSFVSVQFRCGLHCKSLN